MYDLENEPKSLSPAVKKHEQKRKTQQPKNKRRKNEQHATTHHTLSSLSLAMYIFPRTLRDAAEALDVIAAANASTLKLISPAEAIATPPMTGNRVRYTGHGIADPAMNDSNEVKRGSAPFTTCRPTGDREGKAGGGGAGGEGGCRTGVKKLTKL